MKQRTEWKTSTLLTRDWCKTIFKSVICPYLKKIFTKIETHVLNSQLKIQIRNISKWSSQQNDYRKERCKTISPNLSEKKRGRGVEIYIKIIIKQFRNYKYIIASHLFPFISLILKKKRHEMLTGAREYAEYISSVGWAPTPRKSSRIWP